MFIPAFRFYSFLYLVFAGVLFMGTLFVHAPDAQAQVTRTLRVDLNDENRRVYIGPQAFHTEDPEKKLITDNIVVGTDNNNRGTLAGHNVINFGINASPFWLSFNVRNNTKSEDWFIDFGGIFQGRFGQIEALHIQNYDRKEVYFDSQKDFAHEGRFLRNSIAVKVTPGATERFIIYLESAKSLPSTYAPSFISLSKWFDLNQSPNWILILFYSFLLILSGFFTALSLFKQKREYLLCGAFFLLNMGLIIFFENNLLSPFFLSSKIPVLLISAIVIISLNILRDFYEVSEKDSNTYFGTFILGGLVAAACIFAMLPLESLVMSQAYVYFGILGLCGAGLLFTAIRYSLFMQDNVKMHDVTYPFIISFMIFFMGLLFSAMAFGFASSHSALMLDSYIIALIPQGFLLSYAAIRRVRLQSDERIQALTQKNRADEALAKLQKTKEEEDQARLLRVIERERELMSELREKEARQTEEMRRAKDEADEANAAKSAFLAVVSHEIRTPMNGIMGIVKLMQETKLTKEQSDYILTMQKTGDTMVALLNDILDFEKIETGKMDLEHISMDIHAMAKGIVTLMSGYVADKNIELISDIGPNVPPYVMGDPTRIRQVLLNLMSNAIKFTEKGHVTIQLRAVKLIDKPDSVRGDYDVTFSVIDTGVGIPAHVQDTLFEPFKQADSSIARQYGGSGLGLAISMRLVEIMGGAIRLESEVGKGSRFFFSLLMEEGYGDDYETEVSDDDDVVSKPPKAVAPRHILVVEDNEINRKVMQNLLEKDGHHVVMAGSGEQALDILKSERVDIMFVDINLPGISGAEVTRHVRGLDDPYFSILPIIALTGNVLPEDVARIKESGVTDVMSKPIDYDKIRLILSELEATEKVVAEPDTPSDEYEINDSAYDLNILGGLLDTLGVETLTDLLAGCFDKVDEIVDAMGERTEPDADFLYARMHELKGMSYNFGLQEIGNVAAKGEAAAKEKDMEGALAAIERLRAIKNTAKDDIQSWAASKS